MVSVLFSGSSGAGSIEQWSGTLHCVVFLGKTLYSRSASLHPGAGDIYAGGSSSCDGLTSHPGGVEILVVASCYSNQRQALV